MIPFSPRFVGVLLASLMALSFAGCEPSKTRTYDEVEDFKQFKLQLDHNMEQKSRPMKITEVKLDELTEVSDDVVRLNFTATAKYFRNSYIEVNRARALADSGWKEADVQAAVKRLRQLPQDDAAAAEALNPISMLAESFYRSEGNPGDERTFRGHCTARRRATKWAYESWNMEIDNAQLSGVDTSYDVGVALIPSLPPKSMVWNDDHGKRTIAKAVQGLTSFVKAVDAAEAKVTEREKKQTELLRAACEVGKSWVFRDPSDKSNTAWNIDVVACENDGAEVRILARHPTDENRRRMYEGSLIAASVEDMGPYLRPVRHAPHVVFHHGGGGPSLFAEGPEKLLLKIDADLTTTRFFTNLRNAPLTPGENSELLPEAETWRELLARTEPGTQWNGSVTTTRGDSENVIFTVTDRKDDGSYMRVVAESTSDPFTLIVFEGSFLQRYVHGWPIVLKSTQSAIGETSLYNFFRHDENMPPVSLSLHRQGFVGMRGTDKIFLTSTRKLSPWEPRAKLVEQLFAQGARFSGRMETEDDVVEIVLTLAEIRNEGDYVRVIVQELAEPQEIAIYEGRIRKNPEFVDGYCVELIKRQSGSKKEQIFDHYIGTTLALRLALDNSGILGIVRRPEAKILESMKLTRMPSKSEAVSLATADFSQLIKSKFGKGMYWRGTLKDVANNRSTETTLRVMEQVGEGLKIELTSTRAGGGRAVYDGIFRLDDVSVNGYSVTLYKTEGAKVPTNPRALAAYQEALARAPKSEVFDDKTGKERSLKLALAHDGETLLGLAGTQATVRMDQGELLTLRQVAVGGPVKMVPVTAAPAMPQLAGGNFKTLDGTAATTAPTNAATTASTTTATATAGMPAASTASTSPASGSPQATANSPQAASGSTQPAAGSPQPANAPLSLRTWKSSDGRFSVDATFIKLKDDKIVLKRADGTEIEVPLKMLSTADQDFAAQAGGK